jgi:hypothetical protein
MAVESKHVKIFRKLHLKENEEIKAFDDGYIKGAMGSSNSQYSGSLIVTNERVAFHRKGIFGDMLETIPLNSITSIERKSGPLSRTINIHTSHDALKFQTYNKDREAILINAIESGRAGPNQSVQNTQQEQPETPLDQLKKLGELKSAGIITEEEFSLKKIELLNKI